MKIRDKFDKTMDDEPYFGWCNVEGCKNEGCSGGMALYDGAGRDNRICTGICWPDDY